MKILFIASWYPTSKNPNFGIFIKEHAKAIQSSGNEIVILALVIHRSNNLFLLTNTDTHDENGIRTVLIEVNTRFRDIVYHAIPLQYWILKNIFNHKIRNTFNPDIIHSNVIFPAGIIGSWLASYLKKPHVITEHWTRVRNFSKIPVLSLWARNAYRNATKILPVSNYLKSEIIDSYGVDNDKFTIVGNVVDSQTFCFKEKVKNPTELKLCSIATWQYLKNPAKQPELLINAIAELQLNVKQKISLTMVGGGDKLEELKALCAEKKINAIFKGYLPKQEIVKILQESDFFVHPTLVETFGVVVAEALLTGTPVICSNVSALKELINDSNGILCENTVEDWKNAILNGMNLKFDGAKIALNIKQKYDKEKIGIAINKVYHQLNQ